MDLERLFEQRSEFNDVYELDSRVTPGVISFKDFTLQYNLLKEELEEYKEACREGDTIEIADALGDIMYVLIGTLTAHGFDAEDTGKLLNEIHRSNMSKLWDGKVVKDENGKVKKPSTFSEPQIAKVLGFYHEY